MRRCFTAVPLSCTRANQSARPTLAHSGGSSLSTIAPPCSRRRPLSAPSRKRIQKVSCWRTTISRISARCSWLASVPTPTHCNGRKLCCSGRCSITGGRPRLAGASQAIRSACVPMPGYAIDVVDEACHPLPANKIGSIVVKLPLPPGNFPTLWQQDTRFKESYLAEFPGYYKTADAGYMDDDGYLYVMSRTDDIINVAGHRLSTGGMEEVLASHKDVAECAVLGIKDDLKGEVPCGFIVLKTGVSRPPEEIEKEIVALVREKIGPVAAFKIAITVARLPKTRSGKILRGTMKKIADGESWTMPATIDDPMILDEIGKALACHRQGISNFGG